jgi:hypothetical protein
MKNTLKISLVILIALMSNLVNGQVKKVDVYKASLTNSSVEVIYHTKDNDYIKDIFELKQGDQRFYVFPENMSILATEMRKAFQKSLEWDSVAVSNNIEKVMKDNNETEFLTDGGMLYDSQTFKTVSPTKANYRFERFYSEYKKRSFSFMNFGVRQFSDSRVYRAYFGISFELYNDVEEFNKFMSFLDNCVEISNEIVSKDKMNLFK